MSNDKSTIEKGRSIEEAARISAEHLYPGYPFPNDNWSYKAVRLAYIASAIQPN